ncbi:MAG: hypothetical protein IKK82_15410, partial [Kiritimatiellae bacterium]|nr:hypothetical protein [Kiritimatiellia bacterium]
MSAAVTLAVVMFASCASAADKPAIKRLPWKSPEYTLVARQMPIRSALESFSVAQGIPILLSDRVTG